MDDKTCHICSMEYNDDDKITITCGHTFHRFCLLESLKIKSKIIKTFKFSHNEI